MDKEGSRKQSSDQNATVIPQVSLDSPIMLVIWGEMKVEIEHAVSHSVALNW